MTFHYIELKTYCHATESLDKVKKALFFVAGREIDLEKSETEGYYGNPILILTGELTRNREMDKFFRSLPEGLIEELTDGLERRIDERCNFYFRLDKGGAFLEEYRSSRGDNTIRVRARVESYPAKRETAIKKIDKYLKEIK